MPRVSTTVSPFKEQKRLNGRYHLRHNGVPDYTKNGSLLFKDWTVIDGEDLPADPNDPNDAPESPIGKVLSNQFVQIDSSNAKTEKHARFIENYKSQFFTYTNVEYDEDGFETEDFNGVEIEAVVKPKADNDGILKDKIIAIFPVQD